MYDLGAAYDGDQPRIIDSGQIAFTALDSNGKRQAILYQNAHSTVLGTLAGDDNSGATGLNSRGDVIGYSFKTGGNPTPVLFRDSAVIALNSRIATSGWTLVSAKQLSVLAAPTLQQSVSLKQLSISQLLHRQQHQQWMTLGP